jgi:hypothetical protein
MFASSQHTHWFRPIIVGLLCLANLTVWGDGPQDRHTVFARIHPSSLKDLLLFSSLDPESAEGKKALHQAWEILAGQDTENPPQLPAHFERIALSLVKLIEPSLAPTCLSPPLPDDTIALIEAIGASLPHRSLKGHGATTLQELESLPPEEIDVARALVLIDGQPAAKITAVEAALDLLALSLRSRLGPHATDDQKISAITGLLFDELQIRFPPESEAHERTKQFSDLSSVLFSRRGICLGSSSLYLALAQRLGLPLTIYTPPGHIFVAHRSPERIRVIETTARGIAIPIEQYLGLSLKSLPERTQKEVIGMVLFNKAAEKLKSQQWAEALALYHQASHFEEDDELHQMISFCFLMLEKKRQSQETALKALASISPHRLEPDLLLVDLSKGSLSPSAARTIIEWSDAEGDDLLPAINELRDALKNCTTSRTLPLHLAYAYLAYGKSKEALPIVEELAKSEQSQCTIHALLAELYEERMDFVGAWREVKQAVAAAKKNGFLPRPLQEFVVHLQQESPNCTDITEML